jgi:hypothetical protein
MGPPTVAPNSCRRSSGRSMPALLKNQSFAMSASFWW